MNECSLDHVVASSGMPRCFGVNVVNRFLCSQECRGLHIEAAIKMSTYALVVSFKSERISFLAGGEEVLITATHCIAGTHEDDVRQFAG